MYSQMIKLLKHTPIQLYATSLTYYSLLAIVPILAFWLSLLDFLNIDDLFHTIMHGFLDPMGTIGDKVGSTLFDFVHNTQNSIAQKFTFIFFFISAFILIYKLDHTINQLWGLKSSVDKRFFIVWSGIFMFILCSSTLLFSIKIFPRIFQNLATYFFVFLSLVGLFKLIPRTKVRSKNAILGSSCCVILWIPLSRLFHKLIYWNDTYLIIFHDFVGMIIILLWINMLWLLFLFGATICQIDLFSNNKASNEITN